MEAEKVPPTIIPIDTDEGEETAEGSEETGGGEGNTRATWEGSDVTNEHINWLYKSRRIPAEVICRLPGNEIEPRPASGERVVFIAHFQRGLGLPASPFLRAFLDKFHL